VPPPRRLFGTLVLVAFVVTYAFLVGAIGTVRFPEDAPAGPQFAFYAVAGLLWIVPAGYLIKWMYRPAAKPDR